MLSGEGARQHKIIAMPLRHRNSIRYPAVFFVTTSTYNKKPFPNYPVCLRMIEKLIFETAVDKSVVIMGYVIMPTHLHLVVGSKHGGFGLSKFIHSFKGRVRIRLTGRVKLWQDRYDDFVITSEKQFKIKLDYIHYNPVKSNLVSKPEDWLYSSYKDWLKEDNSKGLVFNFKWME